MCSGGTPSECLQLVGVIHCTVRQIARAWQTASWQSLSFDSERVGMLNSACQSNETLTITYAVEVDGEAAQ